MAVNYGIKFCITGINHLQALEDDLFSKTGYGFDYYSMENMQLSEYKRLLKKFRREKELGLPPSYDPNIHGTFEE